MFGECASRQQSSVFAFDLCRPRFWVGVRACPFHAFQACQSFADIRPSTRQSIRAVHVNAERVSDHFCLCLSQTYPQRESKPDACYRFACRLCHHIGFLPWDSHCLPVLNALCGVGCARLREGLSSLFGGEATAPLREYEKRNQISLT